MFNRTRPFWILVTELSNGLKENANGRVLEQLLMFAKVIRPVGFRVNLSKINCLLISV
jgi:hypothetical protein